MSTGTRPGMMVGEKEHHVQGDMLKVGDAAPDFKLTANDWTTKTLNDYAGKVKIISCVPSLDTRVCAAQTRRFNQEASNMSKDMVILIVSSDLPYAQRRWCAAEGIERTETLSSHHDMSFADDYGVHDTDYRITQRAVFVIDKNNVVQLAEYIPVIGQEINFDAALAKARELV
jgi:thioredoxin-dependent peroxiredoxin